MKSLLTAAGLAGGLLLTSTVCWAHAGHDHKARAQRERESRVEDHRGHSAHEARLKLKTGEYARSLQAYLVPDVTLVNADARPARLHDVLAADAPVMMDFIFTSCTTICPTMSTAFSEVPRKLGAQAGTLRMISVTVDPENDKPAKLKAYARQYRAGANWQFLTGSAENVETLLRAFNNYHADKADYGPLTLLRPAPGKPWLRIDGFASADELARELRDLQAQ